MVEAVSINLAKERKSRDQKISDLIDEIEIVTSLIASLKKIDRYLWSIDKRPETVAEMVNLKTRNILLTVRLTRLKG